MKMRHVLAIIVLLSGTGVLVPASGQTWSDKQLEVWTVIKAQWKAAMEKDTTWPDKYLHEKFLGWGNQNPTPRDKSSVKNWERYDMENSTTLMQELFPSGIIVHDNTAVAHYFYSTASENTKGERKTVHATRSVPLYGSAPKGAGSKKQSSNLAECSLISSQP
jgi:hypothetical protein